MKSKSLGFLRRFSYFKPRRDDSKPISSNYRDLTSWWAERSRSGYQQGIAKKHKLHKNSRNLISYLDTTLEELGSVHEIGCGMGRNLFYLLKAYRSQGLPFPRINGNDLVKNACYQYMPRELKGVLRFYEQDTLTFLRNEVEAGNQVDLLISSDHLIHISTAAINEVLALMARFSRKYILIREATKGAEWRVAKADHWFVHDYSFPKFAVIKSDDRRHDKDGEYEIMLWARAALYPKNSAGL